MEFSSPLAAMKPPQLPVSWGCRDLPASRSSHQLGAARFDFNDLSMRKGKTDYFSANPLHGSSPTASLAADLSQNFHIDQSPQLVTPRRSLFSKSLFHAREGHEGTTTPPFRWEGGTTPPIPSSSPGYGADAMDISPLPHKAPFSSVAEVALQSPTPEPSPLDDEALSPTTAPSQPLLEVPQRPLSVQERRKPFMLRPSLARSKNYSTNTVPLKSRENAPPPPAFQFGNGQFNVAKPTESMLDECFSESPPQERKSTLNTMAFPRAKQPLWNLHNSHVRGSALQAGPIRKPAGPTSRPRAKFRRSLSMFESPGQLMKQEAEEYAPSSLQSVMDVDDCQSPRLRLPHFSPDDPDSLPRITDATLVDILDGKFDSVYEKRMIIDCRFEYEYEGGHIDGAHNFCDKEALAKELFSEPCQQNTLLIFHCEYSAHRAPLMAKFVRQKDRSVNEDRYPHLSYPEVYILQGGYSNFYESHKQRCYPQNYLRMDAKEHEQACEEGMNKLRQRTKFCRAQTFAFGQEFSEMEDSPTNQGRVRSGASHSLATFSPDQQPTPTMRQPGARRMASY